MTLKALKILENDSEVLKGRAKHLHSEARIGIDIQAIRENTAKRVNEIGRDVDIYPSNRAAEIPQETYLPFRIATSAFSLPDKVQSRLNDYGKAVVAYYHAADEVYQSLPKDHRWKRYLDHSKPSFIVDLSNDPQSAKHIFLRPDFLLDEKGVTTTEIETSPFGSGLSDFLNVAYQRAGQETQVDPDKFIQTLAASTGLAKNPQLCLGFIITQHTQKYLGQFQYLVRRLEDLGYKALVAYPEELEYLNGEYSKKGRQIDVFYRGFYLHEAADHDRLSTLLCSQKPLYPGVKAHLEEKALMAMLFDREFTSFFQDRLESHFEILLQIFPKTWILGDDNMPDYLQNWLQIADFPSSQRRYVIKPSGFCKESSWGKGVKFLHKLSKEKCRKLIEECLESSRVFVVQEFRKGKDFTQEYFDFRNQKAETMRGRVRLTPYFDTVHGDLLTAKTTLCADTDYIHGMIDAINSPIL